jgi:hypothetical protein
MPGGGPHGQRPSLRRGCGHPGVHRGLLGGGHGRTPRRGVGTGSSVPQTPGGRGQRVLLGRRVGAGDAVRPGGGVGDRPVRTARDQPGHHPRRGRDPAPAASGGEAPGHGAGAHRPAAHGPGGVHLGSGEPGVPRGDVPAGSPGPGAGGGAEGPHRGTAGEGGGTAVHGHQPGRGAGLRAQAVRPGLRHGSGRRGSGHSWRSASLRSGAAKPRGRGKSGTPGTASRKRPPTGPGARRKARRETR